MNKSFLKVAMVAVVAAVAGMGIYSSQKENVASDIMLANVEALAQGESGGTVDCCDNCSGGYCGVFYPANGSGIGIRVYYRQ